MVSRVVVDICSIKISGALGSQRVAGARISPWSEKVIRGKMIGISRRLFDSSIASGRP